MHTLADAQRTVVLVALAAMLILSAPAFAGPMKVYILAGQSNMQGKAQPSTLPAMARDSETKPLYDKIVDANGNPRVHEGVCIAAVSTRRGQRTSKNGPLTVGYGSMLYGDDKSFGTELAFGITMQEHLGEPILIIKTSWGGKSLCVDFRPPSAGPYQVQPHVAKYMKDHNAMEKLEKSLADTRAKSGIYYKWMLEFINTVLADPGQYCSAYDPNEGYELAGFVWFQGYNDAIDGHTYLKEGLDAYKEYSHLMAHFIRDVRKDLKAPELPFVIGAMGIGGDTDGPFQNAQAAPADLPEFRGNVVAVRTGNYWDHELTELDNRMNDLKKAVRQKSKDIGEDDARELEKKMIKEQFTDEELERLENDITNAAFHYFGSAKIYSRIGEAFAKALLELNKAN